MFGASEVGGSHEAVVGHVCFVARNQLMEETEILRNDGAFMRARPALKLPFSVSYSKQETECAGRKNFCFRAFFLPSHPQRAQGLEFG